MDKPTTASLMEARALLASAQSVIEQLLTSDGVSVLSEEEREIVAVAVMIVRAFKSRSRADVLRWVRAVKAGDEGWLVLRSVAGEHRAEARYHSHLGSEVRRALG